MREFYANLKSIKLSTLVMKIREKVVHIKDEKIKRIYALLDSDQSLFTTKNCAWGSWLVSKLCPGKNIPWATTKAGITSSEFMA